MSRCERFEIMAHHRYSGKTFNNDLYILLWHSAPVVAHGAFVLRVIFYHASYCGCQKLPWLAQNARQECGLHGKLHVLVGITCVAKWKTLSGSQTGVLRGMRAHRVTASHKQSGCQECTAAQIQGASAYMGVCRMISSQVQVTQRQHY